ncbi:hypothetical protein Q7P37_006250 [Cladosporium fusiforme]
MDLPYIDLRVRVASRRSAFVHFLNTLTTSPEPRFPLFLQPFPLLPSEKLTSPTHRKPHSLHTDPPYRPPTPTRPSSAPLKDHLAAGPQPKPRANTLPTPKLPDNHHQRHPRPSPDTTTSHQTASASARPMYPAMASSIQDRTPEFRSVLAQAQKTLARQRKTGAAGPQAQPLIQNGSATPTRKQRSEFARNAAAIGRGISATMGKLQRLGELAKRKTLFDDRPVEIAELTYVIKQDLAGLNQQIGNLQQIQRGSTQAGGAAQEGEHNKNVVMLLQGKLADVGVNFKEVLEVRTKNIQASRSRQDNFVSRTPGGTAQQASAQTDVLSLDPSTSSPLYNNGPQSQQQLQIMEEGSTSNSYIQQRGEAIDAIERTIADLGGIFGQLAQMVSEQAEQIQRIDANTDDVVDNVEGAQRELMKYWNRVQGNRWLVAKMFGVLMIFFLLWVLIAG